MRIRPNPLELSLSALRRKYTEPRGLVVKEGTFHVPKDASVSSRAVATADRTRRFIDYNEARNWHLVYPTKVHGPFPAYDLDTNTPRDDVEEWRVRGIFKWRGSYAQTHTIEVPRGAFDRPADPLNRADIKELLKVNF